jgi:hypothetical protein
VVEHRAERFFGEKALLDRLNGMGEAEKEALRKNASDYFAALEKAGLSDEALVRPEHGNPAWLGFVVFAAPLAFLGFLIAWPVRVFSRWVAKKTVKKAEFYTSVLIGAAAIVGSAYFAFLFTLGWLFDITWLPPLALLMPLLAWLSFFWNETLLRWNAARKAMALPERARLVAMRQKLRNLISV